MPPANTTPTQFHSELFKIFDGSDISKKARFVLTGIAAGVERSYTFPDDSGVLVLEGSSPTFNTVYYTGSLIEVKVASAIITVQKDQTGSYASEAWLTYGTHNVRITADYQLTQAPTLDVSKGSLSAFSGSGSTWTATLTLTAESDGVITFSNALLVNGAGTGTTINSGVTHYLDTTPPTISSANFNKTDWRGNDGVVTLTIACGESTTGWSGTVNLSAWGGSSSKALSSSDNNMVATFTPAIADVAPTNATGINIFDRAGNPGTNNNYTSNNQLQTHVYRVSPEDIYFPAYLAVSGVLSGSQVFTTTADVVVTWGVADGQFWPTGTLTYGIGNDFVIDDSNKIHLNETTYADEIAANALGLMFVNVREY